MALEEEFKLIPTTPIDLHPLLEDPWVRCHFLTSVRPLTLEDTYFDTKAMDLWKHHWAFRLRRSSTGLLACLKGTEEIEEGLARRQEWEVAVHGMVSCFSDLPDGKVKTYGGAIAGFMTSLYPLFKTHIQRHVVDISLDGIGRVEMAIDQGTIDGAGRQVAIMEVELEIKMGSVEPVRHFVDWLCQNYSLQVATHSKFSMGLELLAQKKMATPLLDVGIMSKR
ncbi:MAG: CYTH domain-containing protein [Magnetococcus sp. DMHC-6]